MVRGQQQQSGPGQESARSAVKAETRHPIGAKLGTGLACFPLLPTAGWEKVPEGRMRAGARQRDGLASGTTAPLRVAALIRRFAPPSPAQERGRRGSLRRKLAPMVSAAMTNIVFEIRIRFPDQLARLSRGVDRAAAWLRVASPKAVNSLTESGLFAALYSGCHCVPKAKVLAPLTDTASITPSGACASI